MERNEKQLFETEVLISYVLRYGVMLCSAIIGLGLFGRLTGIGKVEQSSGQVIGELMQGRIVSEVQPPHHPIDFLQGFLQAQPDVVIAAGLVLLIALPILRVGMTLLLFLFEKDRAFVIITGIVFSVLLFGIIAGQAL